MSIKVFSTFFLILFIFVFIVDVPTAWCMEDKKNRNALAESFEVYNNQNLSAQSFSTLTKLGNKVAKKLFAEKIDYFSSLPTEILLNIVKQSIPSSLEPENLLKKMHELEKEKKYDEVDALKSKILPEQKKKLIATMKNLISLAQINHTFKDVVLSLDMQKTFIQAIPSDTQLNTTRAMLHLNREKNTTVLFFWTGINDHINNTTEPFFSARILAAKIKILQKISAINPNFIIDEKSLLCRALELKSTELITILIDKGVTVKDKDLKSIEKINDLLVLKAIGKHILGGHSTITLDESNKNELKTVIEKENAPKSTARFLLSLTEFSPYTMTSDRN